MVGFGFTGILLSESCQNEFPFVFLIFFPRSKESIWYLNLLRHTLNIVLHVTLSRQCDHDSCWRCDSKHHWANTWPFYTHGIMFLWDQADLDFDIFYQRFEFRKKTSSNFLVALEGYAIYEGFNSSWRRSNFERHAFSVWGSCLSKCNWTNSVLALW